ncbi:MAG: tRNA pseudouridine(38-40) synthase TruA [Prevotella sp.]|nr:tRNA pseudouridine(38-40) synthase TruA [Prevotella sp.]
MHRYFIFLSFNGARYHGWQVQPNGMSVQQKLQEALSTILRTDIEVTGAGRTDAGVHASMMVAHFDDSNENVDGMGGTYQLTYKLNRLLPYDIAIQQIMEVPETAHARFSATARTYFYFIHTKKDPFLGDRSCFIHYDLDFSLMNKAAALLLENDDFAAFCKAKTDVKTTICQVTKAQWEQIDEHRWRFTITANRFLRNMVRAVVGTLIDVGRGRVTIEQFADILASHRRTEAGESMPPQALFLHKIEYPSEITSLMA